MEIESQELITNSKKKEEDTRSFQEILRAKREQAEAKLEESKQAQALQKPSEMDERKARLLA